MTEPRRPTRRTDEPRSTEPIARRRRGGTQPLPPSRRPGIPGTWILGGLLAVALLVGGGYLIGQTFGNDEKQPKNEKATGQERRQQKKDKGDGQAGGAPRAEGPCGRAIQFAQRTIKIQRRALVNRLAFAEALAAQDVGQIEVLNQDLESLLQRRDELRVPLRRAAAACRRAT